MIYKCLLVSERGADEEVETKIILSNPIWYD